MNIASVLQGIVALIWLVVVGMIVLAVARASRQKSVKGLSTGILVGVVFAIILTSLSAGLVFIQPEQRGVVISAIEPDGYREEALQPGLRWIIPYFESVIQYPISRQTYTMSIAAKEGQVQGDDSVFARTADGQEILLDASVIYAVDQDEVVQIHINWQRRYTEELVRPIARGIVRDAVAQYGVQEVYSSKRAEMTEDINSKMREKLDENGLILVDFILRNITFSEEYAASVEQKQIAEQQAKQAEFVVEQRKQEAEQARQSAEGLADARVIEAKGAAEARLVEAEAEKTALLLIADALRENPDLLTYQYISNLAPGIRVMLVPSDAPYLLPLPSMESEEYAIPTAEPTAVPTPAPTPTPTEESD